MGSDAIIEEFTIKMNQSVCYAEFYSDSKNNSIEGKHVFDEDCYNALKNIKDYFN